jgi:uncharacterized RDD family membrane protein YckC
METPESNPEPGIAPRWRRLVARIIDLAVVAAICVGGLWLLHRAHLDESHFPDLVIFGTLVVYEALVPWGTRGYTLGNWATRIRLVSEGSLAPPSLFSCLGRLATRVAMFAVVAVFIAYDIELPAVIVVLVVEGIVGALTRKRQTIGDIVGRTVVIRRPSSERAV